MIVFLYYALAPWNLIGQKDPIGAEAGFVNVALRVQDD